MFETSNELENPYVFPNGMFMILGFIVDVGKYFEVVMNKEEDRVEQSLNFILSREEEQYLNGMLIRNDEPKT